MRTVVTPLGLPETVEQEKGSSYVQVGRVPCQGTEMSDGGLLDVVAHRSPTTIHGLMDLRAQTATGLADSVVSGFDAPILVTRQSPCVVGRFRRMLAEHG